MKRLYVFLIGIFFCFCSIKAQNEMSYSAKPILSGGISVGYSGGFGMQGSLLISNFAQDFPLSARFALGYSTLNPGDPWAARRIFINDATNGVPVTNGTDWTLRMDLLYRVPFLSLKRFYLFGGVRYSSFSGEFDFIDGNEFFKIDSNQWGLGLGGESYFTLVPGFDLVFTAAADYYFNSTLDGHDTSYSPDGTSINPTHNYTYANADQAINQPKIVLRTMIGFNYRF